MVLARSHESWRKYELCIAWADLLALQSWLQILALQVTPGTSLVLSLDFLPVKLDNSVKNKMVNL